MKSVFAGAVLAVAVAGSAQAATFTNTTPLELSPGVTSGPLFPSPSTISVTGLGTIVSMTVDLFDVAGSWASDLDILLVGPTGQTVVLMSDAASGRHPVSGVNLTFDDAALGSVPSTGPLVSGTYLPTNSGVGDVWDAPAPSGPYGSTLAGFAGTDPNGTWSLFVDDDAGADLHSIDGGWAINFVTDDDMAAVPLPASLPLLVGALGLMAVRRRQA